MPITDPDNACYGTEVKKLDASMPTLLVSAVALIDTDGRVLMQKRPEGKPMAGLWEFPAVRLTTVEHRNGACA